MADRKMVLREVIDFGSTVSGMGYQLYQQDEQGKWIPLQEYRNTWYLPTVIVEKEKNPEAGLEEDLFGNTALLKSKKSNVKASAEFKQYLYNPEGSQYQEAKRLTTKFLGFMRTILESRHNISKEVYETLDKEVYITVPLVASNGIADEMLHIAGNAGFTKGNGYGKVEKMDEARSLTDLVLSVQDSKIGDALYSLAKNPKEYQTILFMDIGGLTIDMNLALIRYDEKDDYAFRQIGIWPQASDRKKVTHLGGGITLDMALKEYLLTNGFVHPQVVEEGIKARGYMDFREFKEYANNEFWMKGETVDRLQGLGADINANLYPEKNYKKAWEQQLSPGLFIKEVAADYIKTIITGIRTALQDGANHTYARELGLDIREETLDWIFITGGGSNMFFMEDMLLGKLPEFIPNLRLEKIKDDPDRILGLDAENKTLACVQGGLLYTGKFILSAVSDYSLEISVYPRYIGKNSGAPLWKETFRIMKKGDVLPLEIPFDKKIPFEYKSNLKGFEVSLELLQNNMHDISRKENIGKMASIKNNMAVASDVGNGLFQAGKVVAVGLGGLAAGAILSGMNNPEGQQILNATKHAIVNHRNEIKNSWKSFKKNLDFANAHKETLEIKGSFVVDKERVLSGTISATSLSTKDNQKPLTITLN